jgi:acetyltransferase-like isoleucine patch superfamily enzyme
MGRFSYGAPIVVVNEGDKAMARVGSFVSIGPDVKLVIGGEHRTDWVSAYPFQARFGQAVACADHHPGTKGDVVIGNDVWIGRGATILSGVHVGDGAVIGAQAVVARSVRPYAIVVGNPAQELRRRFTDAQIEALQRVRWWDWQIEDVLKAAPCLNGASVDEFIARFDQQLSNEPSVEHSGRARSSRARGD